MTKTNSTRKTSQEIQSLISEWEQSNLSKKKFCQEKEINYLTFIGWTGRRRSKNRQKRNKFIPVRLEDKASGIFVEVFLSKGRKIILHQPTDIEFIRAVLKC